MSVTEKKEKRKKITAIVVSETEGKVNSFIEGDENDTTDKENELPLELLILPLRNTVLFPSVVIPVNVSRERSIKLIKKANNGSKILGVITQKENVEEPDANDLYKTGIAARIVKLLTMPDGTSTVILQGMSRFKVEKFEENDDILKAKVKYLKEQKIDESTDENVGLKSVIKDAALKMLKLNPDIPHEAHVALENIDSLVFLIHFISANINVEVEGKQDILETAKIKERGSKLLQLMFKQIQLLEIKNEIHSKVNVDIDQQQRDYFLRQQMRVLQDELGGEGSELEIERMREKAYQKNWSPEILEIFLKELDKVSRSNPASPDYSIALNYVELFFNLPWGKISTDNLDIKNAEKILEKEHFGLKKVKRRILEYLAVLKLTKSLRGPILCLYGPPGVGKTSLGKSIAKALNRQYVRMSLGGLHDEAEIRGHRKTYIGAMPGKILQNLKKAGTDNPVFVLDEIDKVGNDFRGDPASALLEVLDPEQNNTFHDNYLEHDYDLSKVLFIATANNLDTIHPALRDRMEIIEINGYTLEDKIEIVKSHILARQRKEHGLKATDISFDDKIIRQIIERYTAESGVRNLEQKIAAMCRSVAKCVAMGEKYNKKIKEEDVIAVLGAPIFDHELYADNRFAGVVTGLAWTSVGGEILFIESSLSVGSGKLILSGKLGDVMKESAVAALSYLKANYESLGIPYKVFDKYDLHLHVPAGAVPKDGPSAGITILTALASLYTQRKVKSKLAMTGEITLKGKVLPVGGIKEKILAAKRAGISDIIMCKRNKRDIDEIEKNYIEGLTFHFVEYADEVLKLALMDEFVDNKMVFDLGEK